MGYFSQIRLSDPFVFFLVSRVRGDLCEDTFLPQAIGRFLNVKVYSIPVCYAFYHFHLLQVVFTGHWYGDKPVGRVEIRGRDLGWRMKRGAMNGRVGGRQFSVNAKFFTLYTL